MMWITLKVGGEDFVFENECVTMRASIDAYKLLGKIEAAAGSYDDDLINEGLDFVKRMFGNEFTRDELLDGCCESYFTLIPRMLREVVAGISEAVGQIPNGTAATTTGAS